jgi:hypothetical protein
MIRIRQAPGGFTSSDCDVFSRFIHARRRRYPVFLHRQGRLGAAARRAPAYRRAGKAGPESRIEVRVITGTSAAPHKDGEASHNQLDSLAVAALLLLSATSTIDADGA